MKKLFLASLTLVLLSFGLTTTASASESFTDKISENLIGTRAATIKIWFKGIPPETYKGKIRINYYKNQGGYTGEYLNR